MPLVVAVSRPLVEARRHNMKLVRSLLRRRGQILTRRISARPRMHMDLLCRNRFVANRARHHRIEIVTAGFMLMQDRPSAFVRHVNVAPMHD